jgi:hypothetical protein
MQSGALINWRDFYVFDLWCDGHFITLATGVGEQFSSIKTLQSNGYVFTRVVGGLKGGIHETARCR